MKMVHNGIEYGDMQLISEAYSLLKNRKGLDNDAMAVVFDEWNGELDSFLIEITANILRFRDEDGKPLLDKILMSPDKREPANGVRLQLWTRMIR